MKKQISVAIFLSLGVLGSAQNTKDVKIKELLTVMGTTENMKTSYEYVINYYKDAYPDIPADYWKRANKLANYEEIINKIVPIYSKHFSEKEIDDLINFYTTSTGRKIVSEMPSIMKESMEIGEAWGTDLGKRIQEEMEKEFKNPPPPAIKQK